MTLLTAMPKYVAYKGSGGEWLEKIPTSWNLERLKFFSTLKARIGFHGLNSSDFIDDGAYCITGTDFKNGIVDFTNCHHVSKKWYELDTNIQIKNGDVLITKDGTIGKTAVVSDLDKKATLNSGVFLLRPKITYRFLYWLLNSNIFNEQVLIISRGSTINHLYERDFKNFSFPIPSKTEQTAIANFLDNKTAQIDEAITIKKKQIELLKERKQILIQNAVTQGLDPNVPMRDSGHKWLGSIPKHWKLLRVKHIFNLVMQPAEKNNNHELLSVYTDIGVKPRKELEERGNKASTTDGYWLVKKGDIIVNKLLAWMGAIGLSNYDGVTSPAYDILRPTRPIEGRFYHLLFRSNFCSEELKKHSRGIMDMRLRLYFERFGVVEIPYPPVEEQTKIIAHIEQLFLKIDRAIEHQQAQIKNLKEYKTTLINSAVTGKIKIEGNVDDA